jgi:hypothetical protein
MKKNISLMRLVTLEEVDLVIKEIPVGKALGPDGFTTNFFHHCWHLVPEEVWQIIEDSRCLGQVLLALNTTITTLIPKEELVTHPKQLRPIALCNVIYKIITKVITLRLKPILPFIISHEQSRYVEGRQIKDSVILSYEVIHSLKSTSILDMLIKLDLSKSFDKLSWQYMSSLLLAISFDAEWVNWIMNLTSSSFLSILINGVPSNPFSPLPGYPSGRPPFSFSLCYHGEGFKLLHQSCH